MSLTTASHPSSATNPRPPLIEVGWLVVGRLDPVDREAVETARRRLRSTLQQTFPGFDWQMPLVERRDLAQEVREEPVSLLDYGRSERDARHWDFSLVVTGADLMAHDKPYALAAPSRALGVAVLSTVRVDPKAVGAEVAEAERGTVMARRLHALALHLFGHLAGLEHSEDPGDAMYDLSSVADLDRMEGYAGEQVERLSEELRDVADLRLEERRGRRAPVAFYLQAAWLNRDDIASAVRMARPWMFPLRLSRLTTAACSALVILLLTAETWDLGMSQRPWLVGILAAVVLVATTGYVLHRQRLLMRRNRRRLTEQTVVTHVSATLTVFLGLLVTYVGLFALTLAAERLLYPRPLVVEWAASLDGRVAWWRYLVLAGFVATLGVVIGALGASFEEEHHFRHIAYVDEET